MLLHCVLSPQFYWPRGVVRKDNSTNPLRDHSKIGVFSYRIVHNLYCSLQFPHISHITVVRTRGWAHVLLPCQNTAYFVWSKIVKYIQYLALAGKTSSSGLVKHRWPTFLFCVQCSQYRLLQSWFPRVTSAPHLALFRLRSHTDFFFDVLCGSRKTLCS